MMAQAWGRNYKIVLAMIGDFSELCGSKVTEMNIEPVLHVRGQADHGLLSDLLLRTFDGEC